MNEIDAAGYIAALERSGSATALAFRYEQTDEMLLHMTRQISLLRIRRDTFRETFGADPTAFFPEEFEALEKKGLVHAEHDAIRLTPRGMFYADSVAGLLAHRRTVALGKYSGMNTSRPHHMG